MSGKALENIPCETYQLGNGMRVVLHEDHALPLVAIHLLYRVGGRNEPPGKSGFAHLFEHLMFMGTKRVPDFDRLLESSGGTNNASTSMDYTDYHSSGPADMLEELLWVEADRMESLGSALTQEKLDRQREVVINEFRQVHENTPYGQVWLEIPQWLYPPDHPYAHPLSGSLSDLGEASLEDVRRFFGQHYAPSNASLAVTGDFEPAATRQLVEKLFGRLPAAPTPSPSALPPLPAIPLQRKITTDAVQLPKLIMVWHSPAMFAPGDAELEIAAYFLAEEKNSRLYRRLVYDRSLADSVSASQDASLLGSMFVVEAIAQPGVSLRRIEREIDRELARLGSSPPSAREMRRARNILEGAFVLRMEALESRAELLNHYLFYHGKPDGLAQDWARYQSVTPRAVSEAVSRFLDPGHRLIVHINPNKPQPLGHGARPQKSNTSREEARP